MSLLSHATCRAPAVLAVVATWADQELNESPRPGSEAAGLNISHPVLPGNSFDFRTCQSRFLQSGWKLGAGFG
jgi:hypothetical protein